LKHETYDELETAILLPAPKHPGIYVQRNGQLEHFADLDALFPVLHGTFGEDGTLQGLLELADLAYVGAGVLASSVCMDKGLFKDLMIANAVPTLPFRVFNRSQIETDLETCLQICEEISPYPLFTKPANLGSSVGINKCDSRSHLVEGLLEAARYDRRIVVEKGLIDPREIEISILGNEKPIASIPGEVVPKDIFYTYNEKYIHGTAELLIPANLEEQQIQQIQSLAIKAYKVTDCAGMARVDFLIDKYSGELYLNEINTIPGFTSISMYPKLWEASGIPYADLIERLIDLAIGRKFDRDKIERDFKA
jgi:D-alanine-D-alanine ligase